MRPMVDSLASGEVWYHIRTLSRQAKTVVTHCIWKESNARKDALKAESPPLVASSAGLSGQDMVLDDSTKDLGNTNSKIRMRSRTGPARWQ